MSEHTQNTVPGLNGGRLRPWQPGESGNPGGRPSYKPLTAAYAKLGEIDPDDLESYEPKTVWERRAKQMHLNEHVLAAKEIADRVEGTAAKASEDRDSENANVQIRYIFLPGRMTREEWEAKYLDENGKAKMIETTAVDPDDDEDDEPKGAR